jgi:hypothetical protein
MRAYASTVLILLFSMPGISKSLELIQYRGSHCSSDQVGGRNWTAESGCHRDAGGVANGIIVKPVEQSDDSLYAVFFSGNDCNPDNIIGWNDGHGDTSCVKASYGSFEIWNMCEDGQSGCLG